MASRTTQGNIDIFSEYLRSPSRLALNGDTDTDLSERLQRRCWGGKSGVVQQGLYKGDLQRSTIVKGTGAPRCQRWGRLDNCLASLEFTRGALPPEFGGGSTA